MNDNDVVVWWQVELRQAALAAAGAGRGGLATLWLAPAADLRALLRDAAAHAAEQGDDEPFAEVSFSCPHLLLV